MFRLKAGGGAELLSLVFILFDQRLQMLGSRLACYAVGGQYLDSVELRSLILSALCIS